MFITPGGMGQLIKSHFLLKNYRQPISKTSPIVIAERYNDALALFSFISLMIIIGDIKILKLPIIAIGFILLAYIILVKNEKLFSIFQKRLFKGFLRKFESNSLEFNKSLVLLSTTQSLFYGWILSMIAWFFEAVAIFFCFKALGLNVDFIFSTSYGFSADLFGSISFVPGGAGITELIFVQLLSSHGMQLTTAVAFVLFYRLWGIWCAIIGFIFTKFALQISKNKQTGCYGCSDDR